jgi:hypothetical protein
MDLLAYAGLNCIHRGEGVNVFRPSSACEG